MAICHSVSIEAPARLEDELVALLWMHGGEGSWSESIGGPESGRVRIHGFVSGERADGRFAELLTIDPEVVVSPLVPVADRDWAAEWRRASGPIEVGERFLVDPREPDEIEAPVEPAGRILLRLPARTAFGMGSHASTRLAVELLESVEVAGRDVLDVGTGSGILAFAALALGARRVVALDLDPAAALLLPGYRALNGLAPAGYLGTLAALAGRERFDVALVNVIPSEIVSELPRLSELLRPGATAIFSGILAAEAERALAAMAGAGFVERARRTSEEWVAFVAERVGESA